MPDPFGFLNVDKPMGMTSHDVVAKIRRGLKVKKVGHAGTLDPLATGVLIICLGNATRLSEYVMHTTKTYRAVVHLGIETDTYDAEGEITQQLDAAHIVQADVQAVLPQFTGKIEQLPPMYSAIKKDGRKLYELAREGQSVELTPRPVTIHSLTIINWQSPQFTLDVVCGSGTYIRSLAYDIGKLLGVGAHLAGLTRVASGAFKLEDAVTLDAILAADDWQQYLLSTQDALSDLPARYLDEAESAYVLTGRAIEGHIDAEFIRAYSHKGDFIAILRSNGHLLHPHKVFSA